MKDLIILDIDNCISDDRHRIQYIQWGEPDLDKRYYEYHSKCFFDEFNESARYFFNTYHVCLFTARPIYFEKQTREWLAKNGIDNQDNYTLFMRKENDYRKSVKVKKEFLNDLLTKYFSVSKKNIKMAYDDRPEIVAMYLEEGIPAQIMKIHDVCAYTNPFDNSPAKIMEEMAKTFLERNKIYGDNYKRVGEVMKSLFPEGVQLKTIEDFNTWHLFELMIVKMTRFANSNLTHKDSIHDLAVYAAMVESLIKKPIGGNNE